MDDIDSLRVEHDQTMRDEVDAVLERMRLKNEFEKAIELWRMHR